MVTVEEIETLSIEELKSKFVNLFSNVVTTYGDDQEKTEKASEQETTDAK